MSFSFDWNDGTTQGFELYDYVSDERLQNFVQPTSGAFWGLTPENRILLSTSDLDWHLLAFFKKLPYIDAEWMTITLEIEIPDIIPFNQFSIAVDKFTGSMRYPVAIQWLTIPTPRFRYWYAYDEMQPGVPGKEGNGEWRDFPFDASFNFQPNKRYKLYFKYSFQHRYERLQIIDITTGETLADWDLSMIPVKPNPPGAPANTWPAQLRCSVEIANKKLGACSIIVDNVDYRLSTPPPTPPIALIQIPFILGLSGIMGGVM